MYMLYNSIFRSFDFYQEVFEKFEFNKKMTVMVCYIYFLLHTIK